MTFIYSFKPQLKSEQTIEFEKAKEFMVQELESVATVEKLYVGDIVEKAMDDLTGASYRSDEEEWVLCGDLLVPADLCDQKDQDSSDDDGGSSGGSSGETPNDFDGTSGDAPTIPQSPGGADSDEQPSGGFDSSNPGGGSDPTDPTNTGCGDDYDIWRPNPEEYKDYGSLTSIKLIEGGGGNEWNLLLDSMSAETMGL